MMVHKTLIPTICLLCMVLAYASYAELEESAATFTFGKIEVLKAGEQEWRFLEKGMVLTANDLVRMPPFSLIRLKVADDTHLPTLSGGREALVRTLIDEGLQRRDAKIGRRINEDFDESPAIDALPVGSKPKTRNRAEITEKVPVVKISKSELENLRGKINMLPDEIAALVSSFLVTPAREDGQDSTYPAPNFDLARQLYGILNTIESKPSMRPLLYAQLLYYAGLDVDLNVNEKGELFVIFNSNISINYVKKIAANEQLIHKRQGANTVWIAVQIQSYQQNFTTAWYQGSQR